MPEKSYTIWLCDSRFINVYFETFNGRVLMFVVRLSMIEGQKARSVARYDTAHGCPHLDLVDARGRLLEKRWLLGMSLEDALQYAIDDFNENYEHYFEDFKKNA
jgi:hypothetical protein